MNQLFKKGYQFFIRHWLLSTIFSTIASLWFIIVQTLGKQLNWTNSDGTLPPFITWIFWICSIISFLYTILKSKNDFESSKENVNEKKILDEVISCNNLIHTKNYHRLLTYLNNNPDCSNSPFDSMYKPNKEGEELLEQLNICLSTALGGFKRERIGLSIAAKIDGEEEWKIFSKLNTSNNTSINELFQNPQSVAYKVINERKDFLFVLDKSKEYKNHTYVKSSKDGDKVQGSIICCDIGVSSNGKKYVHAILSITTYERTICEDREKDEVEHKIKNIIIPGFEKYFDLLLLRYYIITKYKNQA